MKRPPPPSPSNSSGPAASELACLRVERNGTCALDVSVSPNAKRTEALGLHDGALRVRLAAPPVDGQANSELLRWLASELHVPQRAVTLLRGQTSRRKQVRVEASPEAVEAWLRSILPSS